MLAVKRLAGVAPEANLRECTSCTPLPNVNKAAHSSFETQRRHHQKSKTGISGPQKGRVHQKLKTRTVLTLHVFTGADERDYRAQQGELRLRGRAVSVTSCHTGRDAASRSTRRDARPRCVSLVRPGLQPTCTRLPVSTDLGFVMALSRWPTPAPRRLQWILKRVAI